ncbi:hypothetical protein GCM10023085_36810 [Actinomadura viridis]|uniref:Uncharacterized protein n=1 Tax=Actinomadura viridis TaxID=58110 RepID=A0A931GPV6_9ACTN|nr:hypothetical protein [Actinomadura viridis]MBG6087784.1 hypothetical protein [Actinomadura viridis]
MIALARFQLAGYVRSLRVLQPLLVVLLILSLVLLQGPGGNARLAAGTLGDAAAFMFPVWAWTARALLDTQPDEQRSLTALAVRPRAVAGLLAAYTANIGLGALVLAVPVVQALSAGSGAGVVLAGLGLTLLAALAATVLGAWTSRAIIPHGGVSLLALVGGVAAALLLSLGPLSWLAVPMVGWLRAAHDGPSALIGAFPGIALHLVLWSAAVGAAYLAAARSRP